MKWNKYTIEYFVNIEDLKAESSLEFSVES